MSDTCPTFGAEVQIAGETTKHYELVPGTIVFTPAGKERQMMSRASSVEDRIAEIREYVEREKRGEVASDRYSAARLLDATVYLLERLDELEALVVEAWEEGWRAGWDREPEKDAWRESGTRQALQEDADDRR